MNPRFFLLSLGSILTASALHAQLLSETFTYPDGSLTSGSGGAWVVHSGSASAIQVSGGSAVLAGGAGSREDVNRSLGGTYSDGVLTASFSLDLSGGTIATTGIGTYVLHFKDTTVSGFRGRVYVGSPSTADSDLFRIGLENDASDGAVTIAYSADLDRTAAHTVTISYDVAARTSKLWVDSPTSEAPTLVDNTAATTFLAISSIALRQGSQVFTGLQIDNLVVSYTAVPEPEEWAAIVGVGLVGFALWRRRC